MTAYLEIPFGMRSYNHDRFADYVLVLVEWQSPNLDFGVYGRNLFRGDWWEFLHTENPKLNVYLSDHSTIWLSIRELIDKVFHDPLDISARVTNCMEPDLTPYCNWTAWDVEPLTTEFCAWRTQQLTPQLTKRLPAALTRIVLSYEH